jgi:hypothetical protein
MQWEFVLALIIAIPVIIFPAAFVWYMNIGGIYVAVREALKKQAIHQKGKKTVAEVVRHTTH